MAYITITGDSDGDLHTADLHNKKFGAIASVINGNIDHENLVNPSSEFLITASATYDGSGWYRFGTLTVGDPVAEVPSAAASNIHAPIGSIVRVPFAGTFTDNVTVTVAKSTNHGTGATETFAFELQKSSTVDGTYSKIGNTINEVCGIAAGVELHVVTITGTSGQSLTAGDYIRLIIQNPSSNPSKPPSVTLTARIKTLHV